MKKKLNAVGFILLVGLYFTMVAMIGYYLVYQKFISAKTSDKIWGTISFLIVLALLMPLIGSFKIGRYLSYSSAIIILILKLLVLTIGILALPFINTHGSLRLEILKLMGIGAYLALIIYSFGWIKKKCSQVVNFFKGKLK